MEIPSDILKAGENEIVLSVSNYRLAGYNGYPISGLTSRAANEYTGGITGNIELRAYTTPLKDIVIKIPEDTSSVNVEIISEENKEFFWSVSDNGKEIISGTAREKFSFSTNGMTEEELKTLLKEGKDVLIIGSAPFKSIPCSFKISLAGRTNGNLATVVYDHPVVSAIPHDGFCGWQFAGLFDKGSAVCFENDDVTFNPIIEVVSSHKCVLRQAAMFEFTAFRGRCMVCSFDFKENDPAASYLKAGILEYMKSEKFTPSVNYTENMLDKLIHGKLQNITGNVNLAFNPNDKTALVK